jgi:hypothetical protein
LLAFATNGSKVKKATSKKLLSWKEAAAAGA